MHVSWRSLVFSPDSSSPARSPRATRAQQAVTITGRVTNEAGAPLSLASVYIETLGLGTQTAEDGRYQLIVPAARVHGQQVSLGVRAIGFRNTASLITLTGGTISKDFTLAANPLRLGEVVVTGSGTSTTVEKLGNTINSVKSEDVPEVERVEHRQRARGEGARRRGDVAGGRSGRGLVDHHSRPQDHPGRRPAAVRHRRSADRQLVAQDRRLRRCVDRDQQSRRRHQP